MDRDVVTCSADRKVRALLVHFAAIVSLPWMAGRANAQPGHADAPDPAMARELLKQGYELSRVSRCADAIPLLARSAELDPQAKTYLNLARCEEETSRLSEALGHWVLARDLARDHRLGALKAEAEARLQALESRMPYVTLSLVRGDAVDVVVRRDGVRLPAQALGRPLPVDPGTHVITVEAAGRVARSITFEILPGQRSELALEPGEPREPQPTEALAPRASESGPRSTSASPWLRTPSRAPGAGPASVLFWGGAGIATIGLVTGAVTGVWTLSKSDLRDRCPGGQCPPEVMAEVEQARTTGAVSTVAFSTAAVGLTVAAVGFYLKLRAKGRPAAGPSPELAMKPTLGGVSAQLTFY